MPIISLAHFTVIDDICSAEPMVIGVRPSHGLYLVNCDQAETPERVQTALLSLVEDLEIIYNAEIDNAIIPYIRA